MSDRLKFKFDSVASNRPSDRRQQGPMRILLMGDFSGRANRGAVESGPALANRPIRQVDVDNFEQLMASYHPSLTLSLEGEARAPLTIEFSELEDFHPDALFQRLELFQALRRLRGRLANPESFAQAAAELRHEAEPSQPAQTAPAELAEDDGDMFERLLGKAPAKGDQQRAARTGGIDTFIQEIVAPHIVPETAAEQSSYLASVDDTISSQMRNLLHQANFQALESVWWSAYRMITRLETDEELKIYLLDISKQELAADINAAGEVLQNSGLYKLLVEQGVQTMGGEPWSVLAGDYSFTAGVGDTNLLAALGAIASQAGGPFLAAADSSLLGCESLAKSPSPEQWHTLGPQALHRWQDLRASSVAPWIGLALPRVLQRLPYGAQADEIEGFQFEESPLTSGEHEDYLWGSAAFACAMLLGESFQQQGWSMQPGDRLDIDDLPAFTYQTDEGRELLPCAETLLSERTGEAILQQGLMPLLSYRNRNMVRVLRVQSIADPLSALAGPWNR
jgi:type VI secretion system protein ImpC